VCFLGGFFFGSSYYLGEKGITYSESQGRKETFTPVDPSLSMKGQERGEGLFLEENVLFTKDLEGQVYFQNLYPV